MGIMQLMPGTAKRFGLENPFCVEDNIRAGCQYLAELLDMFDGDLRMTVAAYNAGEGRLQKSGLNYSNPDVYQYVSRVAARYKQLAKKHAEEADRKVRTDE